MFLKVVYTETKKNVQTQLFFIDIRIYTLIIFLTSRSSKQLFNLKCLSLMIMIVSIYY